MRPNDVLTTCKAIIKVLARRYAADHLHNQSRSQGLLAFWLAGFSLLYFQLVIRNVADFMSHFRYSGWFAFSFEPLCSLWLKRVFKELSYGVGFSCKPKKRREGRFKVKSFKQ